MRKSKLTKSLNIPPAMASRTSCLPSSTCRGRERRGGRRGKKRKEERERGRERKREGGEEGRERKREEEEGRERKRKEERGRGREREEGKGGRGGRGRKIERLNHMYTTSCTYLHIWSVMTLKDGHGSQ